MATGRFRRLIVGLSLVILVSGLGAVRSASATTLYAIPSGGATSGSCGSWATACTLQTALGTAGSGDEIWVAKGVYLPTTNVVPSPTNTDQQKTFTPPAGVAVYGGFAGTETSRDERNPAANVTVLSGDIDDNDAVDANGVDESYTDISGNNSYDVVVFGVNSAPASTVLDGFTITAGYNPAADGGGLVCVAFSGGTCSPTLAHLTFNGNSAGGAGAMLLLAYTGATVSPTLTDVTFNHNGSSDSSDYGGAVVLAATLATVSPTLTNVTFYGNHAAGDGGAMTNLVGPSATVSPTLTNVTFDGNSAALGGAIYSYANAGASNLTLINVILWGDTATSSSATDEIDDVNGATSTISYSVVTPGTCGVAGVSCGSGVLTSNPLLGPLQNNGGSTETMALSTGSPAIDAGTNTGCPATDQRGVNRPQDGNGDGSAICDIGAYEPLPPVTAIPTLSPWALILLTLGLALAATPMLVRRS